MEKNKKPSLRESVLALLAELKSAKPKEPEAETPETEPVYAVLEMAGSEGEPAPQHVVPVHASQAETDGLVLQTSGVCPKCGGALSDPMPGVGKRCVQCGWQEISRGTKGFSRTDWLDGTLSARSTRMPREVQMRPPGFMRAMSRLVFGGR